MDLPLESEEVAGFYGAMLETDHAKDATFNKNFFDDFLKILKKYPPVRAFVTFSMLIHSCLGVEERYQDHEV